MGSKVTPRVSLQNGSSPVRSTSERDISRTPEAMGAINDKKECNVEATFRVGYLAFNRESS